MMLSLSLHRSEPLRPHAVVDMARMASARAAEGNDGRTEGMAGARGRGLLLLAVTAPGISGAAAAESVVTYHGALNRSGLCEAPGLTWAKAVTVELDAGFNATVDGAVYAQPLYWVPPSGEGAARIIVATENNFVYALNAATGVRIWRDGPWEAGAALWAAVREHRPNGRHRHPDDRSGRRGSSLEAFSRRPATARATRCSAFRSPPAT